MVILSAQLKNILPPELIKKEGEKQYVYEDDLKTVFDGINQESETLGDMVDPYEEKLSQMRSYLGAWVSTTLHPHSV